MSKNILERMKRCPFCGGEARVQNLIDNVWIECRGCGARSRSVKTSPYQASAEIALKQWNARVSDEQILDKSLLYNDVVEEYGK